MQGYKHFIVVNITGKIIEGWSNGCFPKRDTSGAVLLRENGGCQFKLISTERDNPDLNNTLTRCHLYRYENGQVRKATDAELAAELAEIQAVSIETVKSSKIAASKTQLADYLETHPLTYTDGKQYSVTAEKQSLLTSALAWYQIATAAGVQTSLKWNATGEECTVWEYADLAALALAVAAYVEPLVGQQQATEVAISACSTVAEVEAIVIAYGS
ncbi:MAG: hypothetical protein VB035_09505 [Candidatus Fimivivens sp.]|nr:hypothetical protein [Candidatus Fimivivens sp.]